MTDLLSMLNSMQRPRLLVSAARFGVDDYRRNQHLLRLLGSGRLPRSGEALLQLMEIEADLNDRRLGDEATYLVAQHVDVLIAIMGEARVLRASRPKLVT